MYQVLYFSRGGHTKKVADAIAVELGAKAADIRQTALDPAAEVVFLGSGCYGGKPGPEMLKFINESAFKGKKVGLFGTSAGGAGSEVEEMAQALKGKGANVVGAYHCQGQFMVFFGRGHPNKDDFEKARQFARNTVKKVKA